MKALLPAELATGMQLSPACFSIYHTHNLQLMLRGSVYAYFHIRDGLLDGVRGAYLPAPRHSPGKLGLRSNPIGTTICFSACASRQGSTQENSSLAAIARLNQTSNSLKQLSIQLTWNESGCLAREIGDV